MMSARSEVSIDDATPEKRLEFNRLVMQGVSMGAGGASHKLGQVSKTEFEKLIRGGADITSNLTAPASTALKRNDTAFQSTKIGRCHTAELGALSAA